MIYLLIFLLILLFLKVILNYLFYRKFYVISENIVYYKNNFFNFIDDSVFHKFLKNNLTSKNIKLLKILKDDSRSTVKLFYNKDKKYKIIVKKYNNKIKNKYYLFDEFKKLCYLSNKFNNSFTPEPVLYYTNFSYLINDHFIIYKYIENQPCNDIFYEIFKFIVKIHNLGFIFTDIKKDHFIWNNNKIFIIDIDHHFKENTGLFSDIFFELNILHAINQIPELNRYFNRNISLLSKFLYFFKNK